MRSLMHRRRRRSACFALALLAACSADDSADDSTGSPPPSEATTGQTTAPAETNPEVVPVESQPPQSTTGETTAPAETNPEVVPVGSLPLQDGTFDAQWSTAVGGEVVNVMLGESEIYVAVERGTALDIAAVDILDGVVRWTVTLAEPGEWSPHFNLAVTAPGVMTSFEDSAGGHLVLLDRSSGRELWDTSIEHSAYDLFGEVVDGIGAIATTENSSEIVNLRTGDFMSTPGYSFALDNRLVQQDGAVLRIGIDPLDPSANVTEIQLDSPAAVVDAITADPLLILGADDGTVSGLVDGVRVWNVSIDAPQIYDFHATHDVLTVTTYDPDTREYDWQYLRFDETGADPIAGVPADFRPAAADVYADTAILAGTIDATSGDSSGEINDGVVLAFDPAGVTTLGTFEVPAFAPLEILGDYVVVGVTDEELRVLALDGFGEVARITQPPPEPFEISGLTRFGDDYLVITDGDQLTLYH
jgi:outer membrane protein assembly factor BamB